MQTTSHLTSMIPAPTSVNELVQKLELTKDWRSQHDPSSEAFLNFVAQVFEECTVTFAHLSNAPNEPIPNGDAEQLASAIVEAWAHWDEMFPQHVDSFGRDVFNVGEYHVEAAQFFKPVDFYPGDDAIQKDYRWSVYDSSGRVVLRYYLERSNLSEPYYVLGLMLEDGHRQIQPYGDRKPTYAELKQRVVMDMTGVGPPPITGIDFPPASSVP